MNGLTRIQMQFRRSWKPLPTNSPRARYLHADVVKAVLIMPQSIPSGIYTSRNAMFLAIPDAPSGADK
jgi:hypothetical protein